jgi:hypothetical protein
LTTRRLQNLEEEVVALRSRVAKLEKRAHMHGDDYDDLTPELPDTSPPSRMGRRPLLTDDQLIRRLEDLVILFEGLWPYFEEAIREAKDADYLTMLLNEKLPNRGGDVVFQNLLKNCTTFWKFVTSDRYNHTPRQAACAMAGVPEMSVRTSLDRCAPLLSKIDTTRMRFS